SPGVRAGACCELAQARDRDPARRTRHERVPDPGACPQRRETAVRRRPRRRAQPRAAHAGGARRRPPPRGRALRRPPAPARPRNERGAGLLARRAGGHDVPVGRRIALVRTSRARGALVTVLAWCAAIACAALAPRQDPPPVADEHGGTPPPAPAADARDK